MYDIYKEYRHIMIDAETLDIEFFPLMLQLGISYFDFIQDTPEQHFIMNFVHEDQLDSRIVNPDTVNWWKTQPEDTRKSVFDVKPSAESTKDVMQGIHDIFTYLINDEPEKVMIWSFGAKADLVWLHTMYQDFLPDGKWPFSYKNEMCFRTFCKPHWEYIQRIHPKPPGMHNALVDSRHQMQILKAVINKPQDYIHTRRLPHGEGFNRADSSTVSSSLAA